MAAGTCKAINSVPHQRSEVCTCDLSVAAIICRSATWSRMAQATSASSAMLGMEPQAWMQSWAQMQPSWQ